MKRFGTTLFFEGGNNPDRIGGNCTVLEHVDEKGNETRVMFDLGALFPPEDSKYDAVIPDVRKYISFDDNEPKMTLDAIFISHCHEDHIGGLVHLIKAGGKFPPVYASVYTKELIESFLKESSIAQDFWPQIIEIAPKNKLEIGRNVEIEPFAVSHAATGSYGFHMLTKVHGKDYAGIVHPGDYHLGSVKFGQGFDQKDFVDLVSRKFVTQVLLDSTSTDASDEYLVSFEEAVANTLAIVEQNQNKQVFSAVISRSVNNLAIDLEVAKRTGRKIFIDGYQAKKAYAALRKTGVKDYDDVVFVGNAEAYMKKVSESERYIIPSGAFAEAKDGKLSGLYKMSLQDPKNPKKTGHDFFKMNENTLVLARQRCIEKINGKEVKAMYERLAKLGVVLVENDSSNKTGKYPVAKMQRTGHAVRSETLNFIKMIKDNAKECKNVYCIPVHGEPDKISETAKLIREAGCLPSICHNMDVLEIGNSMVRRLAYNDSVKQSWIAVKDESYAGYSQCVYDLVDSNLQFKENLFIMRGETQISNQKRGAYGDNKEKSVEEMQDLPYKEKMKAHIDTKAIKSKTR